MTKLITEYPEDHSAIALLANVYSHNNQAEIALTLLSKIDVQDTEYLNAKAHALLKLKRHTESIAIAEKIIEQAPNNVAALETLATAWAGPIFDYKSYQKIPSCFFGPDKKEAVRKAISYQSQAISQSKAQHSNQYLSTLLTI